LARNLTFVDHVALMALENTGFAIANSDKLWIDPLDYRTELAGMGMLKTVSAASKRSGAAAFLHPVAHAGVAA
jgi:hypothetical protein